MPLFSWWPRFSTFLLLTDLVLHAYSADSPLNRSESPGCSPHFAAVGNYARQIGVIWCNPEERRICAILCNPEQQGRRFCHPKFMAWRRWAVGLLGLGHDPPRETAFPDQLWFNASPFNGIVMLWKAWNWDISLSPLHNPGATTAGQPLVPNSPWQEPKDHWYFVADGSVGHLLAFFSALTVQGTYRCHLPTQGSLTIPKGKLLGGNLKGVNPSRPV